MKTLSKQSISLNISVTLGFGRRGILQHWHFLRISKKWSLPFREKIFPLFVQAMTEIGKTIYRSKLQLQQARLESTNGNKTVVVGAWNSCDALWFFYCQWACCKSDWQRMECPRKLKNLGFKNRKMWGRTRKDPLQRHTWSQNTW